MTGDGRMPESRRSRTPPQFRYTKDSTARGAAARRSSINDGMEPGETMAHYHERLSNPVNSSTMSGKILLAGVGFLVSSTIWALLGWIQFAWGNGTLGRLDVTLVVLHLLVGTAILKRMRPAIVLGVLLAVFSLIAAFINGYYLSVLADGVSAALLLLSRADFPHNQPGADDR